MGVYVAGGVSGAYISPAVSVGLALRRGFPWAKVGPYILAQVAGAFVAALRDPLELLRVVQPGRPGQDLRHPGRLLHLAGGGDVDLGRGAARSSARPCC